MLFRGETTTGCTRPGNPRWCYFREHDCKMLHHRLQDVQEENFPWKYIAVLWCAHRINSPFTAAAHWTRINAMDWDNHIFFPLKSKLLLGKQRRSFIFFWHSLSKEKASPGSSVLWSGTCHGLPTAEGRREVQNTARPSATNVVQAQ